MLGGLQVKIKQAYFKKAKALVFTSLCYETFGLSVAEARSYGIPCIVPDSCAASEQVIDGETGYLFKTGNLDSLKWEFKGGYCNDYCSNLLKWQYI